ncbi:hypothetical protein PsorP6_003765 [Peronosclerospora sorghi]|uniref:Uncharacterized protein n=1 Tax=Peronosclerospora sorghi TaxID=230839 RepID=A0ACC0VMA2_9STRA|nr:hypothetical protein PsorP6_003765 [Peronosclerospora sorghi]
MTSTTKKQKRSFQKRKRRAWWWTGPPVDNEQEGQVFSSETEVLNAAVLCAALSATQADVPKTSKEANERAVHELEMHVRKSPFPHSLQLPVLVFNRDYVLVQSQFALLCAVRATSTADILQTVIGSAVPLSEPYVYRFGGARIHAPFWKRTQRLDLQEIHRQARQSNKPLFLCGHSVGGSIAQLAFCELIYLQLPIKVRLFLEKRDYDQHQQDKAKGKDTTTSDGLDSGGTIQGIVEEERTMIYGNMPRMLAVGFGSPYIGSTGLTAFLEPLKLTERMITIVNEFDCIPSILNVAQAAAMVAKTTERFVTITNATKTLLNLLPIQTKQRLVDLTARANIGTVPHASSAYVSMSLDILQRTFQKFREFNFMKDMDYEYSPCGTYIFLSHSGSEYCIHTNPCAISEVLHKENEASPTLTGNAILQHLMSAYLTGIARQSGSVQIKASMNFYERLGVSKRATEKQIRSAYKRLALKWHPDRWANNLNTLEEQATAEEVFKLLAESYEVLSNDEARKAYDAHLANSSSFKDDFVRNGTVNGMTLDEAIATFGEVIDNISGAVKKVTSRFSFSNSTTVNPLRVHQHLRSGLYPNNHDNIFAPDKIRVARTVNIGTDQREQVLYLEPEEVMAGDVAAPSPTAHKVHASAGLRTVSVVGGAVAVGASVALIVSAWAKYSEISKKRHQAAVVRDMPADRLLFLLEDNRSTRYTGRNQLLLRQPRARYRRRDASLRAITHSSSTSDTGITQQDVVEKAEHALTILEQEEDAAEDKLVEEFFDCAAEYDTAVIEMTAEEQFFDCIDLLDEMTVHFSDHALEKENRVEELIQKSGVVPESNGISFPRGAVVHTSFGLATVEEWRDGESSAVVRFCDLKLVVGYIQKAHIGRGALAAKVAAQDTLESMRTKLADRVVACYSLDVDNASTIKSILVSSGDGAFDSGIRAAGGVALANGLARTSSVLGGAVAAPLTIASILVDLGKEYYNYRKRYTDRKDLGMHSRTTEQLLIQEFRLRTGEVIASRSAAAAGASFGAYSAASAFGTWGAAGLAAGPVGILATTSAAVVGGMIGYFAGARVYAASTAGYFNSLQNAKEHIDRLELGARVLFDEFDPKATGSISKEDCLTLMKKLYEATGPITESHYEKTKAVLQDGAFQGPVSWSMFWEWVSTKAAGALRKLEEDESNKVESAASQAGGWWNSYITCFSYLSSKPAGSLIADSHVAMYPSVLTALGLKVKKIVSAPEAAGLRTYKAAEETLVLKAQTEYLVNNGHLTSRDAFQLVEQLESVDRVLRESARKSITAMHEGLHDVGADQHVVSDGFGFTGGDDVEASRNEAETRSDLTRPLAPAVNENTKNFEPDEGLNVMCSLMSTQGLQHFLEEQRIIVARGDNKAAVRREDLHCLALKAAVGVEKN